MLALFHVCIHTFKCVYIQKCHDKEGMRISSKIGLYLNEFEIHFYFEYKRNVFNIPSYFIEHNFCLIVR